MTGKELVGKVKELPGFVKTHWNTPFKKGWSLGIKEMLAYCVGGMGASGVNLFVTFYALTTGIYMAAELAISVDHLMWVAIVTNLIAIVRTPLISWIIDNVQTKRFGKFRPWLLWLPIPCIALMFFLGYLPAFSAGNYWALIITYVVGYAILQTLLTIYYFSYTSLQQVISPSPEERSVIMSVGSILYSLGPSIVNIIFPLLANLIYSTNGQGPGGSGGSDGINQIGTYQTILPIMAIVLFAIGFLTAFGTKERVVIAKTVKNEKKKTGFFGGLKSVVKNKYFWLYNATQALNAFRLLITSFQGFVYIYILRNVWAQSVFTSVLGFACVPGMALAPIFIKKMGVRNTILTSFIGVAVSSALGAILPLINMPLVPMGYILLVVMFFGFLAQGITVVAFPMQLAQVYDIQQYKTGQRLEGFIGQFGTIFATSFTIVQMIITPIVYSSFGYISDTNALYNRSTITGIISTMSFIGLGATLISIVPMLFWNVSNKRHDQIMEILKVRAAYEDGKCDEETKNDLEARIEGGELGLFAEMFPEEDAVLTQPDDEAAELQAIAEAADAATPTSPMGDSSAENLETLTFDGEEGNTSAPNDAVGENKNGNEEE